MEEIEREGVCRGVVAVVMVDMLFCGVVVLMGNVRVGGVEVVVKIGSLDSVVIVLAEERVLEVEDVTGMDEIMEELEKTMVVEVVVLFLALLTLHPGGRVHDLVVTLIEALVVVAFFVVK